MATRENNPELQKLFDAGVPVYSFSKLECMHGCLYEAYRTYILHDRKNQLQNVYSIMGGSTHDCLEKITNGEATEADLLPTIQEDISMCDMLGISFPKGRDGSDSIKDGWVADMEHFCKTYKQPKGKFDTELFFLYQTPKGRYLQGYIDLIKFHSDKEISIYDYKTSSMYKGEDILSHSRQLTLYAMGMEAQGYTVKNIGWIFLKYCEVKFVGKKTSRSKEETELSKIIERKNLIKDLESYIVSKLEKLGMDEVDIEVEMMNAKDKNEIPTQVADQFKIIPYVMKYDLNGETRAEAAQYFDDTIDMWEGLSDNEVDYPHISFTKIQKNGKEVEDTFYCTQLCGYRKCCPHLQKFMDTKENKSEDDDLF